MLNKLYKLHPDLAFNPFSWSDESEFFITFAKKFSFFKNQKFYFYDNYYNIMRKYLKLELKQIKLYDIKYDFKNILICPESSENRRSLTIEQIKFLINKYKDKHITLAVNKKIKINENINQFLFSKKNSKEFLNLIKKSDIIMCVDSAPLHIAMLYDKQIIAFFSSSSPRRVLNSDKYVLPVRNNVLYGVECEDKTCNEAICLDFIKERFDKYTLETKRTKLIYNCPIKKENIESVY
ncbi:glycosyltransferase family 9 protein [Nautilia lithotrophica]